MATHLASEALPGLRPASPRRTPQHPTASRWSVSRLGFMAWFFLVSGGVSAALAGLIFAKGGAWLHPLLADPMAGIGFLVIAVSTLGAYLFPLWVRRFTQRHDRAGQQAR